MGRWSRRRTLVVGLVIAVVVGTGTVTALTSAGSRLIGQNTAGVIGSAEAGDFLGVAVAIGDFDGDGRGDVAVGAPFEDARAGADVGQVHVLSGTRSGPSTDGDQKLSFGTNRVPGRSAAQDRFGHELAVGDFDADGFDDLAVGVPGRDAGGVTDSGMVVIFYGTDRGLRGNGSQTLTQASLTSSAVVPHVGDAFGASLAVGDFDGDGFDDLVVGAPEDAETAARGGAVTVFVGAADGLSTAGIHLTQGDTVDGVVEIDDRFGWSLAAGDFDGDGFDDLVVGAPGETLDGVVAAGSAHVFAGSALGVTATDALTLSEADPAIKGDAEPDDRFAAALAVGDFDGDDHDDLVIGVPGEGKGRKVGSGAVHVVPGGVDGLGVEATKKFSQSTSGVVGKVASGDDFGAALAVGDFNDNGRDDLAVGAPGETIDGLPGAGAVHVLFGSGQGIRARNDELWHQGLRGVPGSAAPNAGFGRAVAAGDIDRDGRDDLVVGVPGDDAGAVSAAGAIVVLFG